ncbi:MAG: PASTA domain-containing protein [Lawsonibacter sp.]|nr:PASTA domain-containing protein [Lawsonibacter sp.]
MAICGLVLFVPLFWKLWDISILHHDDYQQKAAKQQTVDLAVTASRGNIYDRNGNVMAMSATVYTLIVSPNDLKKSVKETDYEDAEGNLDHEAWAAALAAKQVKVVEDILEMFPDLDRERVTNQVKAIKYSYREIKTNIEEEEAEAIRIYMTENKTSTYLYIIPSTKRYYPYSSLAAQTLGFVNANGGAVGIEAQYDDVLEGTAGRVVTTKTASGAEMFSSYSEFVDAIDGYDLTLTLDATIQSYAEKTLQKGIEAYDIQNGGFCIVMDPNTAAVLAIASSPDFDPNHYDVVSDQLKGEMEENTRSIYEELKKSNTENLTDSELMQRAEAQAYSDAVNTQWRSRALDSRYEPGSTFKALVLSAALEEGKVSLSDNFQCSGSVMVDGYDKPIHCARRTGHGTESLAEAVQNSCNPAFIRIGQRLGIDLFYDYLEAFGITERTGIDLPGEASSKGGVWDRNKMTGVDLAVGSFGQRLEVTPLQMITAFSAAINGGKLLQPHVVQSISTKDGTVVKNTEPTVVRQVISQETSQTVTSILESVVSAPRGSGRNAYVAGYRIGGKTGTAEVKTEEGHYIVSFIGFAPADDPQVIVLLAFDEPKQASPGSMYCTTGTYISGGNMAAVQAGPMIAEILDYMGVEKKLNADESAAVDVTTPKVTGKTVKEAEDVLEKANLKLRTVGNGDTITHQVPASGASIPGGSTVVLYLGDAAPEEAGTVPNVVGLTYDAARKKLEDAGFFMRASGVSTYYSKTTTAESQGVAGETQAAIGTVVNVRFTNMVEDGWVDVG